MDKTTEAAQQLGRRGGNETAKRHGKKHFSEAGKKGMTKRWGHKDKKTLARKMLTDQERKNHTPIFESRTWEDRKKAIAERVERKKMRNKTAISIEPLKGN